MNIHHTSPLPRSTAPGSRVPDWARWAALLLVVCGLALSPAARASEPAALPGAPPLDAELMGMVVRDPWFDFGTNPAYPGQPNRAFQDRMGATLAELGVRWVRMDFRINAGIGAPQETVTSEIAKNDYFITEVAPRHGFKVLGLLSFDLLQGVDANLLNTGPYTLTSKYGGGVNAYMQEWLDRALLIADRYDGNVAAYQVLNEQNRLPQYTPAIPAGGKIEPAVVGRLVTKLYRFCRGVEVLADEPVHGCRSAQIVMGGLHPRGTSYPSSMTDAAYLKAIYADPSSFAGYYAKYGAWPVDGIGYHPYPEEIRLSEKDAQVDSGVARIRTALQDANDSCRQLWITEVGYNVGFDVDGPKNPIPQQTEVGQAAFMRDVYTTLGARRLGEACGARPEIAHIFWFKYEDFPPAEDVFSPAGQLTAAAQRWGVVRIPFRAPADGESCPGGACYEVSGVPQVYRLAYETYRELAPERLHLPLMFR